jgi:hypothetical protein
MRMWVRDPQAGGVKIPKRVQERTKQRLEAYAETRSAPYRRWACMRCNPIWRSWKWKPTSSSMILAVESTWHRFNDRHRERARQRRWSLYSTTFGGLPSPPMSCIFRNCTVRLGSQEGPRRTMNPSGMILAVRKPELRETIEPLADLGWMTPVLALREWGSKLDGIHPLPVALNLDIDQLNHHFDLLQTFLASAAKDVREWSSQTLLHELRSVL